MDRSPESTHGTHVWQSARKFENVSPVTRVLVKGRKDMEIAGIGINTEFVKLEYGALMPLPLDRGHVWRTHWYIYEIIHGLRPWASNSVRSMVRKPFNEASRKVLCLVLDCEGLCEGVHSHNISVDHTSAVTIVCCTPNDQSNHGGS